MILKQRKMVQQIISMDALKESESSTVILNAQHFQVIRLRDKKSKLRRLTEKKSSEKLHRKYLSVIIAIVGFMGILTYTKLYDIINIQNGLMIMYQTFVTTYQNQFKEIVYGRSSFCNPEFHLEKLNSTIRERKILYQDEAIEDVFKVLQWQSGIVQTENDQTQMLENRLRTMAFVGTHGIGKTLLSNAIMDGFPWPNNVHSYHWNTKVVNEHQRFQLIRVIIEQLSECGWNLLIIDNLNACDYSLVSIINQQFLQITANTQKRLILIYIFSLNTLNLSKNSLTEQIRYIEDLNVTKMIYFKQFNRRELLQCIYREMEMEDVTLKIEDLDDILDSIDPIESGCKNVNAKVLMYGTIKRSLDMNKDMNEDLDEKSKSIDSEFDEKLIPA